MRPEAKSASFAAGGASPLHDKVRQATEPVVSNASQGVKFDQDKLPWDLLPWDSLAEVGRVLQCGAKKYAPRNWENGIAYSRLFAAAVRHEVSWFQNGEEFDPDIFEKFGVKVHPLACAICDLLFALTYSLRGQEGQALASGALDDRPVARDTERPPAPEPALYLPSLGETCDLDWLENAIRDWRRTPSPRDQAIEAELRRVLTPFVNGTPSSEATAP
jgi:hypothetical protein